MSNAHIFEYLDYYVDLPQPPHYAVMLTGPWGIGKSFHVKQYVTSLQKRGKKVAYVSLYGVKSIDEIAVSILAALTPKLDTKLAKLGGQIVRSVLTKYAGGNGEAAIAWLPDAFCDLLIMDDLERAALPPVEVLGFVNTFIEHEDRKVVIVANEAELKDPESYRRVREKVIGMTFEFAEETDTALQHFIATINDAETKAFLTGHSDGIRRIFNQSKTQNLRLLDQSLRAWERMHKVIEPAMKKKQAGMLNAFDLFLALSLEMRSGRIGKDSLINRISKIVAGHATKGDKQAAEGTPLSKAQDRYGRLYLHDSILSDDVLLQVLCDGRIDAQAINASLAVHPQFVEPEEEPNWRKVWHGFLRDAVEFESAFNAMEQEFAERQFEEPGVVLHVLGLRLWCVEIGELAKTEQDVVSEGKAYIDDLRRAGKLPRCKPATDFYDAAYGLVYYNVNTPAFRELHAYFAKQCELAYQDGWPKLAEGLLDDMAGDAEAFYQRVCWSGAATRPDCAEDPILASVSAKRFVDRLIECTPEGQRAVLEALKERYGSGRLSNDLAAERIWLLDLKKELDARIPTLPRIRQYSLSKDRDRLLGYALDQSRSSVGAVAIVSKPDASAVSVSHSVDAVNSATAVAGELASADVDCHRPLAGEDPPCAHIPSQ